MRGHIPPVTTAAVVHRAQRVQRGQSPVHEAAKGVQLWRFADQELRRVVASKPFHAACFYRAMQMPPAKRRIHSGPAAPGGECRLRGRRRAPQRRKWCARICRHRAQFHASFRSGETRRRCSVVQRPRRGEAGHTSTPSSRRARFDPTVPGAAFRSSWTPYLMIYDAIVTHPLLNTTDAKGDGRCWTWFVGLQFDELIPLRT